MNDIDGATSTLDMIRLAHQQHATYHNVCISDMYWTQHRKVQCETRDAVRSLSAEHNSSRHVVTPLVATQFRTHDGNPIHRVTVWTLSQNPSRGALNNLLLRSASSVVLKRLWPHNPPRDQSCMFKVRFPSVTVRRQPTDWPLRFALPCPVAAENFVTFRRGVVAATKASEGKDQRWDYTLLYVT